MSLPDRALYHGSKHRVIGLTKSATLEYTTKGIKSMPCAGHHRYAEVAAMLGMEAEAIKEILTDQPVTRPVGSRGSPLPFFRLCRLA